MADLIKYKLLSLAMPEIPNASFGRQSKNTKRAVSRGQEMTHPVECAPYCA